MSLLRFLFPLLIAAALQAAPNIVIIYADDLGYGDLGSYGHPTIRTPNLDRMADEGSRWTSFYSAAPVCTPSRAALLTGRHPLRSGTMAARPRVFAERSLQGLPDDEITIAEMLKTKGYATGMVGKWHLGHMPGYLPTRQGFDEFFGLVSSNDHNKTYDTSLGREPAFSGPSEKWDIPLMDGEDVVEKPAQQHTLTQRYTARALDFIERHRDEPFFLYFAHTFPHTPLFRSDGFAGRSERGIYGDVVEELDWSVGRILDLLWEQDLAENTLVIFASDNGPWLPFKDHGGSAGPLREGKGSTWEGGVRVPGIFWQPGTVRQGVVGGIGATLDILPTVAAMTGAEAPADRPLDGVDLSPALLRGEPSPRQEMLYYRAGELFAFRHGPHKIHFLTQTGYTEPQPTRHDPPALYQLDHDPGERYDISAKHPELVQRLAGLARERDKALERGPDQLKHMADGPVGVFTHPPTGGGQ